VIDKSAGAFFGVAFVVIATPGQDTALTIRNTLMGGTRAGLSTALGVSAGQAIWATSTSLGIGAVVMASDSVFLVLKALGSGFLLLLGMRSAVNAIHGSGDMNDDPSGIGTSGTGLAATTALRQGLVSNLVNPKMLVFFTSLLPQFANSFGGLLALGVAFSLMTLTWLGGYTLALGRAGRTLRHPPVRRAIEAVTGIALMAFGAGLAIRGGWR
jgi:threonine/homoserine/homoserine lactone efflux protein